MNRRKFIKSIVFLSVSLAFVMGCKKLTQVNEPVNTITTAETFGSDATATSAIVAIYNDLLTGRGGSNGNGNINFGNGITTVDLGLSADELHNTWGISPFETNTLSAVRGEAGYFWSPPYFDVYLSNAAIEGLSNSPGVSAVTKDQLLGEAKFFRAFCHFYLVNLFGDVPLLTTTAYAINDTMHRTPAAQVYQLIVKDLTDAQNLLAADYSISDGERVRVNKFGAIAMLARVYLYTGQWANAEGQASAVIANAGLYNLESDPNAVFLKESREAILQLKTFNAYPYATFEANNILPPDPTQPPNYYLTDSLLNAFEIGDLRRQAWVDSSSYSGNLYYYPYKYKVRVGTKNNIDEYQTLLRLAEQYLIRAEARARQGNNLAGAIADLNMLRERAGLSDLPSSLDQTQVLAAVAQERRVELFAEWGHRWLDLKRTGQADAVLGYKLHWKTTDALYPIPGSEMINDANLIQNPGY